MGPFEGNPYGYANGNPLTHVDPNGENPLLIAWAAYELGSSLWDLWTATSAWLDECTSWQEKLAITGLAVAGVIIPGGGYSGSGKVILRGMHHPKVAAAVKKGIQAHMSWRPGPAFVKNFRLPNGMVADAVDFQRRIVLELKPNNARAILRGERQLSKYIEQLQAISPGEWAGFVETN